MQLLTADDFVPWIGRMVRVNAVPEAVEVTLVRVTRHPPTPLIPREPFSLYFESPLDVMLLDGGYSFDCGKGGPHSIYVSAKQPGAVRTYEAVFA